MGCTKMPDNKKSKFIKEQEDRGLLRSLGIRKLLIKFIC